jgi:hypothetical protein
MLRKVEKTGEKSFNRSLFLHFLAIFDLGIAAFRNFIKNF